MSNFERATEENTLFQTGIGELNVIQLWQLKPRKVDGKVVDYLIDYEEELQKQIASFGLNTRRSSRTKEQEDAEFKLSIVSHILDVREIRAQEAKEISSKKVHNQKIMNLIAKKEEDHLGDLSVDELRALLKN